MPFTELQSYLGGEPVPAQNKKTEADKAAELALVQTFPFGTPHKPDLPPHLIERAGIRYSVDDQGEPEKVYYPYYDQGELVDYKVRILPKTFYALTGKHNKAELFGEHLVPEGRRGLLVIVEGEDDKIAAEAMFDRLGKAYTVVSIQTGANEDGVISQAVRRRLGWITEFKKVALCLDQDQPGQATQDALADLIAPHVEVRLMRLPTGCKDAYDVFKRGWFDAWMDALNQAKRYSPAGIIEGPSIRLADLKEPSKPGYELPYPVLQKKLHGLRPGEITLMTGGTGAGKCLGYGTPVMMHSGLTKPVQDIRAGDTLMGPDGTPRTVQVISSGSEQLYQVDQLNGDSYVVNESHILSLKATTTKGWRIGGKRYDIPVRDYLAMNKTSKAHLKGHKADLRAFGGGTTLRVDPYLLGLWIADGTSAKPQITFSKEDILLRDICSEILGYRGNVCPTNDREGCVAVDFYGHFHKQLSEYGLLGNKHVPLEYRTASYADRLKLLAGWIDGDGHLYNGVYEVIVGDPSLAENLVFIARSVGLRVSIKDKFSKCPGFDGATYKRVSISGELSKLPVQLERKRFQGRPNKDPLVTGIKVTPLGEGKYYGFTLKEDPLFCLGDLTVTHNTTLSREIAYHLMTAHGLTIGNIFLEEQYTKTANGFIAIDNNIPLPLLRANPSLLPDAAWQASYDRFYGSGRAHFFKHFGSVNSELLLSKMLYMVLALGCDFIFLDHVTMVLSGNQTSDERKDIDVLMTRLAELVTETGVGVIPVVHLKRVGDIDFTHGEEISVTHLRGSSQLEALSFNILAQERDMYGPQPDITKLRLLKNREWGHVGVCDRLLYNHQTGRQLPVSAL